MLIEKWRGHFLLNVYVDSMTLALTSSGMQCDF